ncbi:EAL domain-containing protein [Thiohalocapsa marina]|uniref:EAL domain-containing protein n=1 Tax=Thiohalocapsa marina TaxID=424902 RepID=A0A5M8FKC3_9GAMM|nr:EAL domain-containing protein [Thiohalocapsa marina]
MRTGTIGKAEALLRWLHPQEGLISPARFAPLAEKNGLIAPIGRMAFRAACRQLVRWRQRHALQLSINKSPLEFQQASGDCVVLDFMQSVGLPGSAIAVEITEGLLLETAGQVGEQLNALRTAGIHLSLDDFCTGYSSMAYLQKIEIGFIKIDKAFVRDLETNPADRVL